jgi:hypothetical protein
MPIIANMLIAANMRIAAPMRIVANMRIGLIGANRANMGRLIVATRLPRHDALKSGGGRAGLS